MSLTFSFNATIASEGLVIFRDSEAADSDAEVDARAFEDLAEVEPSSCPDIV